MTLQQLLIAIPSFVVVLGVVVFVHEFGHFQAARLRKVAVDTFSIGFGAALVRWRDKSGVNWKIGAIPLGGYVKFADDADGVSMGPRETIEDPEAKAEARRRGMFHAQPLLTRAIVVAAGPVTNFVFAIFAFAFLAFMLGRDVTDYASFPARIGQVAPQSAAQAAGLQVGDTITAVNGAPIATWAVFQDTVTHNGARAMQLTVTRHGGTPLTISVTPQIKQRLNADGTSSLGPVVGVQLDQTARPLVIERIQPLDAVVIGARETWALVTTTGNYVAGIFMGRNSGAEISGPLGILAASGRTASNAASVAMASPGDTPGGVPGAVALGLLFMAAQLSVAVGLVNLLPIPILDGGHLFFYLIEAVRRGRPLPPAAQEWAFRAGLAVMASLFLFATWNDITRHLWSQG